LTKSIDSDHIDQDKRTTQDKLGTQYGGLLSPKLHYLIGETVATHKLHPLYGSPILNQDTINNFNLDDPNSMLHIVPQPIGKAILSSYVLMPEVFKINSGDLSNRIRPTPTLNMVRLSFWTCYERCQANMEDRIIMEDIIRGVCTLTHMKTNILADPKQVAWMITPPPEYGKVTEEGLMYGLDQMRSILAIPHVLYDPQDIDPTTGQPKPNTYPIQMNAKLAELKVKIVAMLDIRIKGAPMQRSVNFQLQTTPKQIAAAIEAKSVEELDERIKEIEEELSGVEKQKQQDAYAERMRNVLRNTNALDFMKASRDPSDEDHNEE
jgi:hypothetical protein